MAIGVKGGSRDRGEGRWVGCRAGRRVGRWEGRQGGLTHTQTNKLQFNCPHALRTQGLKYFAWEHPSIYIYKYIYVYIYVYV